MELLNGLKWRYATKKYDASKQVSEEDLAKIKEAIQLAATSYGLQPFKVLDIRDQQLREDLKVAASGQSPVTDASHLFVFCHYDEVTPARIDAYLALKAEIEGKDISLLKGFGDYMKSKMTEMPKEQQQAWTSRQVYIALANALSACGELQIDSTPMEGFDPAAFDQKLGLEAKGLKSVVLMAIGYRSEDDSTQHRLKVRKPIDETFEMI